MTPFPFFMLHALSRNTLDHIVKTLIVNLEKTVSLSQTQSRPQKLCSCLANLLFGSLGIYCVIVLRIKRAASHPLNAEYTPVNIQPTVVLISTQTILDPLKMIVWMMAWWLNFAFSSIEYAINSKLWIISSHIPSMRRLTNGMLEIKQILFGY